MARWPKSAAAVTLALATALGAMAGGAAADPASIEGRWLTGKRGVVISLFRCGDELCGRIDWLKKPRYRGGELKIDRENPDPALRDRPWCGIDVVSRLREKKPGLWKGGKIYNPKDGGTYDLEIRENGERLRVHAYLGIKLLGKTEDWIRATDEIPGCTEQG